MIETKGRDGPLPLEEIAVLVDCPGDAVQNHAEVYIHDEDKPSEDPINTPEMDERKFDVSHNETLVSATPALSG
jgi:hypothetical protein